MPERIQRRRTKGWQMPENTVYVGRPTKWGNPYSRGQITQIAALAVTDDVVLAFRILVTSEASWPYREEAKRVLRGKNLACWCPLYGENGVRIPCHADILLQMANGWSDDEARRLLPAHRKEMFEVQPD